MAPSSRQAPCSTKVHAGEPVEGRQLEQVTSVPPLRLSDDLLRPYGFEEFSLLTVQYREATRCREISEAEADAYAQSLDAFRSRWTSALEVIRKIKEYRASVKRAGASCRIDDDRQHDPTSPKGDTSHLSNDAHTSDSGEQQTTSNGLSTEREKKRELLRPKRGTKSVTRSHPVPPDVLQIYPAVFSTSHYQFHHKPGGTLLLRAPRRCAFATSSGQEKCLYYGERIVRMAWGRTLVPKLAVASESGHITMWHLPAGKRPRPSWEMKPVIKVSSPVRALFFASSDQYLVLSSDCRNKEKGMKPDAIRLVNLSGPQSLIKSISVPLFDIPNLGMCREEHHPVLVTGTDSMMVVFGTCAVGEIAIYRLESNENVSQVVSRLTAIPAATGCVQSLAELPGTSWVAGLYHSYLAIWDIDQSCIVSLTVLPGANPTSTIVTAEVPAKLAAILRQRVSSQVVSTTPVAALVTISTPGNQGHVCVSIVIGKSNRVCLRYLESSDLLEAVATVAFLFGVRRDGSIACWDRRADGPPLVYQGIGGYTCLASGPGGNYVAAAAKECVHLFEV